MDADVVDMAVEEYNRFRSPEAVVRIVEHRGMASSLSSPGASA
jgi:hypothetical protein